MSEIRITPKSLVPLGSAATVVMALLVYIASGLFDRMDRLEAQSALRNLEDSKKYEDLRVGLIRIDTRLALQDERNSDLWTGRDTQSMLDRFARLNPNLAVPEIGDLLGDTR